MTESTTLKDRLRADSIAALKAGDKTRLNTLRTVIGEIETREKSGKTPVELTDLQVISLLVKQVRTRQDTAQTYSEAGHDERAATELAEAAVLTPYLPSQWSEAEVTEVIDGVIHQMARQSGEPVTMRQMGPVIKAVQARAAGRFDGKAIAALVKARIG